MNALSVTLVFCNECGHLRDASRRRVSHLHEQTCAACEGPLLRRPIFVRQELIEIWDAITETLIAIPTSNGESLP